MASYIKGGDNKLYQIVMVILTTIIAPVVVYAITQGIGSPDRMETPIAAAAGDIATASQPAPAATQLTLIAPGSLPVFAMATTSAVDAYTTRTAANLPALTETQPTASPTRFLTPTRTASPTLLPTVALFDTQPVKTETPAGPGSTVVSSSLQVWIDPDEVSREGNLLGFSLHIRNLGSKSQSINYTLRALRVQADDEKWLAYVLGSQRTTCRQQDLDKKRTLLVGAGQEVVLAAVDSKKPAGWCDRGAVNLLPLYELPDRDYGGELTMVLQDFGPFHNAQLEISADWAD